MEGGYNLENIDRVYWISERDKHNCGGSSLSPVCETYNDSVEFAELVITSIEEAEDGSVSIDPLSFAASSMDHVSQLSGLLKWIRF